MIGSDQISFIALIANTLILWVFILFIHQKRARFTLIPLYGFIAGLVVYTHTLSSVGLNVIHWNLYFHVASTAYFTSLLLAIFMLYLFDGVKAARKALEIIILVSILQVFVVLISGVEDSQNIFIPLNIANLSNYFWSLIAMIIDIILMAGLWEYLSKINKIPIFVKVPVLIFFVFAVDALIFATAVFGSNPSYFEIIKTDLIVRGGLAIIMGTVISRYLQASKYSEEKRIKPERIWDIVNFRSELEKEVEELQLEISKRQEVEKRLLDTQAKLSEQVEELKRTNSFMIDRELKIVELKKELERVKNTPA